MKKLTKYQREVLSRAAESKDGGTWALSVTEHVLADAGLLQLENEHSEAKQKPMQAKIDALVKKATKALTRGDWKEAYQFLSEANDQHREMTFMVYRITDAGRKAVAEAGGA